MGVLTDLLTSQGGEPPEPRDLVYPISLIKAGCGNATPERPLDLETSCMAYLIDFDLGGSVN